jgi:hypothetical protein
MCSVSLYSFSSSNIKISVKAIFKGDELVIDGYDIGKTVEEFFGDSDYEYSLIIHADEVQKLYPLFKVEAGNKRQLLSAIKERFHANNCFSEFSKYLDQNNVKCKGISWT